jgi:hypothetical protein
MNADGFSFGCRLIAFAGLLMWRSSVILNSAIMVSFSWFLAVGDIRRGIACAGCAVEVSGWWGKEYLLRSRVPMVFRIHGSFF